MTAINTSPPIQPVGAAIAAPDNPLTPDMLRRMNAYWRAANYLSVGQIYLRDNAMLERPLTNSVLYNVGLAEPLALLRNDAF